MPISWRDAPACITDQKTDILVLSTIVILDKLRARFNLASPRRYRVILAIYR